MKVVEDEGVPRLHDQGLTREPGARAAAEEVNTIGTPHTRVLRTGSRQRAISRRTGSGGWPGWP